MTDAELADYLGIAGHPNSAEIIARIEPRRRASYERMAAVEFELGEWIAGRRPRPTLVLIDMDDGRAIFA